MLSIFKPLMLQIQESFSDFQYKKVLEFLPQLPQSVLAVEKFQQHTYHNKNIVAIALLHRSVFVYFPKNKQGVHSNERLEFLGDSFLNFFAASHTMALFPQWSEGELSMFRSAIVGTESLAQKAKYLGLHKHLCVGRGEIKRQNDYPQNILADAFEASLAALLVDAGPDKAISWLKTLFEEEFQKGSEILDDFDAKSRFQQWMQSFSGKVPEYRMFSGFDDGQKGYYVMEGVVGNRVVAQAEGCNKREASKAVAKKMLDYVKQGLLTEEMILTYLGKKE